jgi:hypothetical protein
MAGQRETARQANVYAGSAAHPEVDEIQLTGTTPWACNEDLVKLRAQAPLRRVRQETREKQT